MQVAPSGDQIRNCGGTWWPNLEPMQLAFFLLAEKITQVKEAMFSLIVSFLIQNFFDCADLT